MTQYNSIKVNFSDSQLDKFNKNESRRTLTLSSYMIGNTSYETNFPYTFLLTNRHVSKLYKSSLNGLTANIKSSKTQLLLKTGSLLKPGLPLIKNVLEILARIVLMSLGIATAASTKHVEIHKK